MSHQLSGLKLAGCKKSKTVLDFTHICARGIICADHFVSGCKLGRPFGRQNNYVFESEELRNPEKHSNVDRESECL